MNAIEGFVPLDVIRTFAAFLEFCYIARRNVISERSLEDLKAALQWFHKYRVVFSGTVRPDGLAGFSLPRQHSLVHYHDNIKNFGSPNGLCSSITESKHIVAVKRPWRRSSRYKALSQILKINERLDKLVTARADFITRGMLTNSSLLTTILDTLRNSNREDDVPQGSRGNNGSGGVNDNDGNSSVNDDNGGVNNSSGSSGIDNANDNANNGINNDVDDDDDDDAGPVELEPLMNEVRLAHEKGKYHLFCASRIFHELHNQLLLANTHQHSQALGSRLASMIYPTSSNAFFSTNFILIPTSNPTTFPSSSVQCHGTHGSQYSTPPLPPFVLLVTHLGQEECTGRLFIPLHSGPGVIFRRHVEIAFLSTWG